MGLHKNKNGLFNLCDNGFFQLSDCPSFDCRPIAYVDKHATGANNGTSQIDAYTDIQTAINNDPCKEIQIQGYGEFDTYPAGVVLAECVYLKGVDDMWIDGDGGSEFGINGGDGSPANQIIESTYLVNINIKNCNNGFLSCYSVELSTVKTSAQGFTSCMFVTACTVTDIQFAGFWSIILENNVISNCTAINCDIGFAFIKATIIDCVSFNNRDVGFFSITSLLINSISHDNQSCGFYSTALTTYTNCSEFNNCLSGDALCTPGDPTYICDTV